MSGPARPIVALIAAVARNRVIGRGNELVWHDPADARHFRSSTMGCPVIMGRRTWESLPARFRPLPGRRNVVVTRQIDWSDAGAEVAHSLDEALARLAEAPKVFVIGGGQLYAQALAQADELVLTEIDADFDGDTCFPEWRGAEAGFVEVARQAGTPQPGGPAFDFVSWRRTAPLPHPAA